METSINNGYISLGTEMIGFMLKDKRFEDYDKYIIGVGGLNEMFNVTETFNWGAWDEQLIISKYIKSGKLKWLPEHVDALYDEYQNKITNTGMNLYETKTHKKTVAKESRIKLYNDI